MTFLLFFFFPPLPPLPPAHAQLMEILSDPANEEYIAWLPHGCSFRVHNRARFLNEILPPHYKNKKIKYTSFTRKLSRWDFVRLSSGPDTGAFYHKLFQRDNPKLVRRMFCKGERTQFPRNLSALANLPPHMQAAVAAGMPGSFGGMGWNAALAGMPQAQAQAPQALGQAQMQMQAPMMQQPMMDPMQLQMQQQMQQQQNFAAMSSQDQPQGTMMANTSSHSGDGSTTPNASASDQQDSSSAAKEQLQQQVPAPPANPAGMAIGPADMTAFLASMNNPNISPAVKAQMLAQQQTLLQQQQLILQQQLAASGINVAVTPNPPVTVPTAQEQQQQQEPEQDQATAASEPQPQQEQQEDEQPTQQEEPKIQEAPAQQQNQQQSVSQGELQLEIQRQMDLLRAQQAAALQSQQSRDQQQQMSTHDFLAAQAAAKLDTSNLQFTPMPAPGQHVGVGAGREASTTPGSGRSPSAESGGAVKRAWAG